MTQNGNNYVNLKVFLTALAIIVSAFGYTNYQVGQSTEKAYEAINRSRDNEVTIGRLEERMNSLETLLKGILLEVKDINKKI